MPPRPAPEEGRFVFHIYNRAIEGVTLFQAFEEYRGFLRLMEHVMRRRIAVPLIAYSLMPTHWHLVVWPHTVGSLSRFMHVLSLTQAMEWRRVRGTPGRGAVYQGRFRAVPVQEDGHLLRLIRYVERNALRARLVERAEDWPWTSASPAALQACRPPLDPWPVAKPPGWLDVLNVPEPSRDAAQFREAVRSGRPIGDAAWQEEITKRLGWTFPARRREDRNGSGGEPRSALPCGMMLV